MNRPEPTRNRPGTDQHPTRNRPVLLGSVEGTDQEPTRTDQEPTRKRSENEQKIEKTCAFLLVGKYFVAQSLFIS